MLISVFVSFDLDQDNNDETELPATVPPFKLRTWRKCDINLTKCTSYDTFLLNRDGEMKNRCEN